MCRYRQVVCRWGEGCCVFVFGADGTMERWGDGVRGDDGMGQKEAAPGPAAGQAGAVVMSQHHITPEDLQGGLWWVAPVIRTVRRAARGPHPIGQRWVGLCWAGLGCLLCRRSAGRQPPPTI